MGIISGFFVFIFIWEKEELVSFYLVFDWCVYDIFFLLC